MDKGLTLDNVSIFKDGSPLLSLSATVAPGEVLSIMGPSGVGKSTLLAFVTGTLAQDFSVSGSVHLDGIDITTTPPHQRRVGILFQDDLLFPHLSVGANLAFGLNAGGSKTDRLSKIDAALVEVGLAGSRWSDHHAGTDSIGLDRLEIVAQPYPKAIWETYDDHQCCCLGRKRP